MRVTNKMLSNNFLTDMRNNLGDMQTLQQQLSSGKEIRKPSDDPFKVARIMQLNSDIDANLQYNENISDTINFLDTTDTALSHAGNVLQRVRELIVSAGNGSYGPQERNAIRDEIDAKVGELGQILNTNFDGKYIFGGSRGDAKPVTVVSKTGENSKLIYNSNNPATPDTEANAVEINKIGAKLSVEVSQGVILKYNVSANDILQFTNEKGETCDLRQMLTQLTNHLQGKSDDGTTTDATAVSKLNTTDLKGITDSINNLLKLRSEVGAKQNRMDSAKDRNEEENYNMTDILSKTEDIDFTKKTMQLATAQTIYMASLQTSAKIIQPSLMDYLR